MSKLSAAGKFAFTLVLAGVAHSQNTDAVITGRVTDSRSGDNLPGATVRAISALADVPGVIRADAHGFYSLSSLPPGVYTIRAEAADHQPGEIQQLEVTVSAFLEINFELRPRSEALDPGGYSGAARADATPIVPVLGPDLASGRSAPVQTTTVQSLLRQPSLSYVITPREIAQAPLSARNVFAMTITLPGMAVAPVTGRGLQISANGQRASASSYLLDGVENNDFLNTGAFSSTAPESIQEYRISTSNYSAEYGHTGGFIANAVSRSGTNRLHGEAYSYLDTQSLDANTFQNNWQGLDKNPFHQLYAGYWAGGPIRRNRLYFSSSFEQLRSHSSSNRSPLAVVVPADLRNCGGSNVSSGILNLYDQFPLTQPKVLFQLPYNFGPCYSVKQNVVTLPVSVDRSLAIERLDYRSPGGTSTISGRAAISRTTQPDRYFSPYQGLSAPLIRNTYDFLITYDRVFRPGLVNNLRVAFTPGSVSLRTPHPEIPILQYLYNSSSIISTPSSTNPIDFATRGSQWELSDALTWNRGPVIITTGGSLLLRRPQYLLAYLSQGLYNFNPGAPFVTPSADRLTASIPDNPLGPYATGRPSYYELSLSRQDFQNRKAVALPPPGYDRYSSNQFSGYVQANWKLAPRLAINLGARYEYYGTLSNLSSVQGSLQLGAGSSIEERLSGASVVFAKRPAYSPDRNNWAGRFGISYSPWNSTALRAGYGIFFDRPFDNLFLDARNNALMVAVAANGPLDLSQPLAQVFANGSLTSVNPINTVNPTQRQTNYGTYDTLVHSIFPELLWTDAKLRTPYIQSWFVSLQQQVTRDFFLEINHAGSLARKLIATDLVNRVCSVVCSNAPASNPLGRLNPSLGDILYRNNSGSSDYAALSALARYRTSHALFQAAYTYSHTIDNQSDPLLSDIFNLAATNLDAIGSPRGFGVFTRQFDSRADRGNADFDIRQNLIFYSIWEAPWTFGSRWPGRILAGWQFSQLAAIRSGLPYTLYSPGSNIPQSGGILVGTRVDILSDSLLKASAPAPGGVSVIGDRSVGVPGAGQTGDLGRNALRGAGFWNLDLSLKRSFRLAPLGESGLVQLRVDAFNVLNHSNLDLPQVFATNGSFATALYGPTDQQTQFPAAVSALPSPRRLQLQLKVIF